jgi:hypothetical protein
MAAIAPPKIAAMEPALQGRIPAGFSNTIEIRGGGQDVFGKSRLKHDCVVAPMLISLIKVSTSD